MRFALATLLVASLALADPADAPKLEPLQVLSHDEQVACLTCADDLAREKSTDRVSAKWIWVAAGLAIVAGAAIGFGAGLAAAKK